MIKKYLENYFSKIKALKQVARDNGLNWFIPLFNSMLITFIISFHLSNGAWFLLDYWQDSQMYEPWYMGSLWEISSFLPMIIMATILFTVQDKVILFFIKLNAFTNKQILKAISKLDMYLWRKYDKQNMITNFIWKLQMKYVNRSKKEKKIITFAFVACIGVYYAAIFIN